MNADRRKRLDDLMKSFKTIITPEVAAAIEVVKTVEGKIDDLKNALEEVRDEEQEAYDNLPESLQQAERGSTMQDAISAMEEAISALEEANSTVEALDLDETLQGKLDEAEGAVDNARSY